MGTATGLNGESTVGSIDTRIEISVGKHAGETKIVQRDGHINNRSSTEIIKSARAASVGVNGDDRVISNCTVELGCKLCIFTKVASNRSFLSGGNTSQQSSSRRTSEKLNQFHREIPLFSYISHGHDRATTVFKRSGWRFR
ncbi:hypothetical protein OA2633_07639 [Oceanicaulis sp. HTCC2633]|nr:hypothetical protein OA2633_07639 [Oceanicaulis sp. HTCC2633]